MQPHQERVIKEQEELGEKIKKLEAFLGAAVAKTLPQEEQARLHEQHGHMMAYHEVLGRRIEAF